MDPAASDILARVAAYAARRHRPAHFDPAHPSVPVSGKVFGAEEVVALVRAGLDTS
jgi:CDP-4-dehydro-6-deoxyglucose reductase, E1